MRPCSPACVIGLAQINSRNFSAGLDVSHTDSLRLSASDAQTSRPVCRSVSSSTRRVLSSGSACRTERPETPLQVKEKKQNRNAGRPEVSFSAWRLRGVVFHVAAANPLPACGGQQAVARPLVPWRRARRTCLPGQVCTAHTSRKVLAGALSAFRLGGRPSSREEASVSGRCTRRRTCSRLTHPYPTHAVRSSAAGTPR